MTRDEVKLFALAFVPIIILAMAVMRERVAPKNHQEVLIEKLVAIEARMTSVESSLTTLANILMEKEKREFDRIIPPGTEFWYNTLTIETNCLRSLQLNGKEENHEP